MDETRNTAISLFSSGGIGDIALRASGFEVLVSNEKLADRHALFEYNFPETLAITGDIWENVDAIYEATKARLQGRPLSLFYATPPCQGMSKNGRGKLLNAVRAGRKPALDERNRLIIPTIALATRLQPEMLLFENVPEMAGTVISDQTGALVNVVDFIRRELGPRYAGSAEVVEFADYGVPQCRKRLITVFSRNHRVREFLRLFKTLMPPPTHAAVADAAKQQWVTVRDVIGGVPPLDAATKEAATSAIPFHRVPLLDAMKYWWVKNTAPERSAFDNQCVICNFDQNPTHSAKRDRDGINRASRKTPLYCLECGELLPRPHVLRDGRRVLMKGYTSAYKRMSYDKPASALTRNLSYACSDNKLHPTQNRVLSLFEAFRVHTVDQFDYHWKRADGKTVSDKTIREIIGESIPPAGLKVVMDHLAAICRGTAKVESPGELYSPSSTGMLVAELR